MVPKRIGEWEILRELGRGEFSSVYECRNVRDSRSLWAMKCSPVSTGVVSDQKKRESKQQVCARLLYWESQVYSLYAKDHEQFPRIPTQSRFYSDDSNGWRYLVMEKLVGGTLREKVEELRPAQLNATAMFSMAVRILAGLENLNQKWFVYRDLKPENVCLTLDSRGVVLVDFGTAQKFVDAKREHFSGKGFKSVGTPQFMSIPVHQGLAPSRRDDLESLGYLMLWVLNCGSLPAWEKCKSEREMLEIKLAYSDYGVLQDYFNLVLKLGVKDEPDYRKLEEILIRLGGKKHRAIDWSGSSTKQRRQLHVEPVVAVPSTPPKSARKKTPKSQKTARRTAAAVEAVKAVERASAVSSPVMKPNESVQQQQQPRSVPWYIFLLAILFAVATAMVKRYMFVA